MARYHATIETGRSAEAVFAYLSDFSTAQEWDPGVVEAERLGEEPVGEGKRFRLVAEFMGRRIPLTYRIVEYDPPHAVTFVGESLTATSRDRIVFERAGEGTRVTYDADLQLKGGLRFLDPLLRIAFTRTGDRALRALRTALSRRGPQGLDAAA
jgi:carbon monoxide dehydrogenase subunit G